MVVRIDAELKAQYSQVMARLKRAKDRGAAAWHDKYNAVAAIVEHAPPLYLAGGFATDQAFFAAELGESRQIVSRNLRVAKLASREEVATFTASRLDLAIAYVEATTKQPVAGRESIDFAKLNIQFKAKRKLVNKPLLGTSILELRLALSQAKGFRPAHESPAAKAIVAAVKDSGIKGATATVTRTKVTLRAPVQKLPELIKALGQFKLPVD